MSTVSQLNGHGTLHSVDLSTLNQQPYVTL